MGVITTSDKYSMPIGKLSEKTRGTSMAGLISYRYNSINTALISIYWIYSLIICRIGTYTLYNKGHRGCNKEANMRLGKQSPGSNSISTRKVKNWENLGHVSFYFSFFFLASKT